MVYLCPSLRRIQFYQVVTKSGRQRPERLSLRNGEAMSENLFGLTVAADKGLDDLQCQRLLSENRRYQEVMLQYRCALKALESRLEILNEEFSLQHDRNPIESMKSRLKSPSSIMNKMQKRGLSLDFPTMQANIRIFAGVRVDLLFRGGCVLFGKVLKKLDLTLKLSEKDYFTPEAKWLSQSAPDDPAAGIFCRKRNPCASGDTTPHNRYGLLGKS